MAARTTAVVSFAICFIFGVGCCWRGAVANGGGLLTAGACQGEPRRLEYDAFEPELGAVAQQPLRRGLL
jgi:hypothetical protein